MSLYISLSIARISYFASNTCFSSTLHKRIHHEYTQKEWNKVEVEPGIGLSGFSDLSGKDDDDVLKYMKLRKGK